MSMSKKKCCVPGCMELGNSHETLHQFPNPSKDRNRFNQWVLSIGGDIIGLDNEDIYKYRSVCHSHFEEKFCCRYNRLSNNAVPTLYLPGSKLSYGGKGSRRKDSSLATTASTSSATQSTDTSVSNQEFNRDAIMQENIDPVPKTSIPAFKKFNTKYENVPTLSNWAWTLDSLEILTKKLEREYSITSVWMRHLNQDPIENFFGAIRSHGCRNTNPTPEKFEGAFTTLLINNMSSVHAPAGANCEVDFCENLHTLIIPNDCKATPSVISDFDKIPNVIVQDIETKKHDPRKMAPLQYVSGYLVKKAKTKVFKNCQECSKNLIATEGVVEYIKYREYAGKRWLCSPTEATVNCVSIMQDISHNIVSECFEKNNIKELAKTYILMFITFEFVKCVEHKEELINYIINLTLKFFIYNYCKDINKILNGRTDCNDDNDKFQVMAKKHFKKCIKRPKK